LTRLDRDTGQYIWREPVADPLDTILGLVYLPDDDLVVVATGDSLLMYDESAGYLKQRQNLTKVASSGPVHIGPFMVYASGNGQVCWHSHEVKRPLQVLPGVVAHGPQAAVPRRPDRCGQRRRPRDGARCGGSPPDLEPADARQHRGRARCRRRRGVRR
jgi:hypothetical protein